MKSGPWRNLIFTGALSLTATGAFALGLGEARLLSYLGEPLHIEIEAFNDEQLPLDALKPRIPGSASYAAQGLDKPVALMDARITPYVRGNRTYLRVESPESVRDLWLPLLVEIGAGNGVTRKHYDFLVDQLPATSPRPVAAAKPTAAVQVESKTAPTERSANANAGNMPKVAIANRLETPAAQRPAGLELKLDYGEALFGIERSTAARHLELRPGAALAHGQSASLGRPVVRLASIRTSGLLDDAGILDAAPPPRTQDGTVQPASSLRRHAALPARKEEAARSKRYEALDNLLGEAEARVGQFEELLQSLAADVSALEQKKASLERALSAAPQPQGPAAAPARHSATPSTDVRGNFLATVFGTLMLGVAGGLGFSSRHRVRSALRTRIDEWKQHRATRTPPAQEEQTVPAPVPKKAPRRHSELDFTQS